MLSYYIVDIGYAINMFSILTVLLDYKRSRRTLPIAYVLGLCIYMILDFICITEIPGLSMQVSFVLAGYFEMFSTFGMVCLFTRGNVWRSYTFLILAYVLINALTSFLVALDPRIEEIFASYLVNGDVPIYAAWIFVLCLTISGIIVTTVMSKILKKEYKGNGRIYLIFSLAYALLGIAQVVFKTSAVQEGFEQDGVANLPKVIFVAIGVSTFYAFGLMYYRSEKKALAKENAKLVEYIQSNDARYQKLVEDNKKLSSVKNDIMDYAEGINEDNRQEYKMEMESLAKEVSGAALTGNIVIDALIKEFYDKAQKQGISCEIIPGNVSFAENRIINYATIIENILIVASACAKKAKDKWIYLSFRQNEEMVLLKVEFAKEKKEKLSAGANVLQKQTDNMHRLKLIKSLSEIMTGTVNINNKDDEGSISVLLNNS